MDLWQAPLAEAGDPSAPVSEALAAPEVDVPHALLVDSEQRPIGWLSDRDLKQERVPEVPDSIADLQIDADQTLRDGLAALLQSGSLYAPVVDGRGRLTGVLSAEIVSDFLASPEAAEDAIPAVDRPHD